MNDLQRHIRLFLQTEIQTGERERMNATYDRQDRPSWTPWPCERHSSPKTPNVGPSWPAGLAG